MNHKMMPKTVACKNIPHEEVNDCIALHYLLFSSQWEIIKIKSHSLKAPWQEVRTVLHKCSVCHFILMISSSKINYWNPKLKQSLS